MNRALPIAIFLILAGFLGVGLTLKPKDIPSALIGKPVPAFNLAGLDGGPGLTDADLKAGQPIVLNVWASWCGPCRDEHKVLSALAADPGVTLYGIAYKDKPAAAQAFLNELGNPFRKLGADVTGRVAIDFGVYGVPETYVINGDGNIILKHVGPLSPADVADKIKPALARAGS